MTALIYVFPAFMVWVAVSDLLTMTIPNRVSLLLLAAFAALAPLAGLPLAAVGVHVLMGFAVLLAGFALFAAGWIGGGDAKVAAAIAVWLGPAGVLPFLVHAAFLGGLLTLAIMALRLVPLPASATRAPWVARLHDRGTGIPYGIALAAAALLNYPGAVWAALG